MAQMADALAESAESAGMVSSAGLRNKAAAFARQERGSDTGRQWTFEKSVPVAGAVRTCKFAH